MNRTHISPYGLGYGLILIPFLSLLIASVLFMIGISINAWIFPLSVVISVSVVGAKQSNKWTYMAVLYTLLLCLLYVSSLAIDYSTDGQWYHQNIIYALVKGWNPVLEHHSPFVLSTNELWVNHYAKGLETISATISSFTGSIESGKSVNFMIIFSSFFFVYDFLSVKFNGFKRGKKLFLTAFIVLCPVVVNQLLTYYIDWSLYSFYLIACTVLLNRQGHSSQFVLLGIILFLSSTIKMNILFHIGLLIASISIYHLYVKRYLYVKKIFLTSFLAVAGGIFVGAYNPYVTNILDHGNPFYPLVGEESTDIMAGQMQSLEDKNRVESVFTSLFSRPQHSINAVGNYVINKSNFVSAGAPDPRLGGFGLFFIEILTLSMFLFVISKDQEGRKKYYYLALLYLFVSLLILPAGWWARYNPYFYLFPLCMLLYVEKNGFNRKWPLVVKKMLYAFFILNICVSAGGVLGGELFHKARLEYYLDRLSGLSTPIPLYSPRNAAIRYKLEERNINYIDCVEDSTNYELKILGPDVFVDSTGFLPESKSQSIFFLIDK